MSLHRVTWRVNASSLDNTDLVEHSLKWISGEKSSITTEIDKSFHGSKQYSIIAITQKKKEAIESLKRLGKETLQTILDDGIEKRLDDSKNLHIRIELSELVCGEVLLANENTTTATVKAKFKIESYPGDSVTEVITDLIEKILDSS